MRIGLTSVHVVDQDHALDFYTNVLGFVEKENFPVGEFKWLTVVSPEDPEGVELLLEPADNPAAATYQRALLEQGIPAASFAVDDVEFEVERLTGLGVEFTAPPTDLGTAKLAIFNDTCGNLIQIAGR